MSKRPFARALSAIEGLLNADPRTLKRGRWLVTYVLRVARETLRELQGASFLMRASALAFSSLLALVPLVVLLSGVTAGLFPGESEKFLDRVAAALVPATDGSDVARVEAAADARQQDVLVSARRTLRDQLAGINTHARQINIIGFIVLLYAVLSLLESIEESMNVVWHVRKGRTWLEKLPYYSAILFLAPIFMMLSISLTATLQAVAASAAELWLIPSWARGLPGFLLKHTLPVLLMAAALWVTYLWMPTAKVKRAPAILAAALGAVGLEGLKQLFLVGAISVIRTNKIYGSLAVLPIVFLWLYLSWVIIICGAAVAFVMQNFADLAAKAQAGRRDLQWRVYYALRIVVEVARRFRAGGDPRVVPHLQHALDLPEYALRELCGELSTQHVLTQVGEDPDAFVPGRSLLTLTVGDVIRAAGEPDLDAPPSDPDPSFGAISAVLTRLADARDSVARITVADLLHSTAALSGEAG